MADTDGGNRSLTPYYEQDGFQIFHGDCREVVSLLDGIDAVISDVPYGMNWNTDTTRFSGGKQVVSRGKDWGKPIHEDNQPFDPEPWLQFPRVVLFGSNHYASRLPLGTTLIWVKRNEEAYGSFLSDAEMAWMKGGHGIYCFRDVPNIKDRGLHPTQKPVPLMAWCIEKAGVPVGGLVLDPFMGSGTTLVAAKETGRRGVGIEVDESYCEIAANRLRQGVLFGAA